MIIISPGTDTKPGVFAAHKFGLTGNGDTSDPALTKMANMFSEASAYALANGHGAEIELGYGAYYAGETLSLTRDGVNVTGKGAGGHNANVQTLIVPVQDFTNNTPVLHFDGTALSRPLSACHLRGVRIGADTLDNTVHGVHWRVYLGLVDDLVVDLAGNGSAIRIEGYGAPWDAYQNRFSRLELWGAGDPANQTNSGIEIVGSVIDSFFSDSQVHGFRYGTKGGQTGNRYTAVHFWGNGNNVLLDGGGVQPQFTGGSFREPKYHNFQVDTAGGAVTDLIITGCNFRTTATLAATNTYDNLILMRSSGTNTVSGVMSNCPLLAATGGNVPRYHVNMLAAAAQFRADISRADNNAASGRYDYASAGVRCTVNGLGRNAGNPNSAGNWFGFAEPGIDVLDTVAGSTIYKAIDATTWVALN